MSNIMFVKDDIRELGETIIRITSELSTVRAEADALREVMQSALDALGRHDAAWAAALLNTALQSHRPHGEEK